MDGGPLALYGARLVTPRVEIARGYVLIEDGAIVGVGEGSPPGGADRVDLGGLVVAPGFIDTHVHGIAGRDASEASAEALASMSAALARHGVTSFVPTLVTSPRDVTLRFCDALAEFARSWSPQLGARPLGGHLEGPFISPSRAGAQDVASIRPPSVEELRDYLGRCGGLLREITVAPELPGALDVVREASRAGVAVQLGHSDATYAQAVAGFAAGATKVTHLYDAMRPFHHREPGLVGAALLSEGVYAEVILDLVHVSPQAFSLAYRLLGSSRLVLVTDSMAAADMPDGTYRLGRVEVEVRGGVARIRGTEVLAGSTLTLDRAVRNAASLGVGLREAVAMATLTPAASIGAHVAERVGALAPGMRADLVVLDGSLSVVATMIEGRVAYASEAAKSLGLA